MPYKNSILNGKEYVRCLRATKNIMAVSKSTLLFYFSFVLKKGIVKFESTTSRAFPPENGHKTN